MRSSDKHSKTKFERINFPYVVLNCFLLAKNIVCSFLLVPLVSTFSEYSIWLAANVLGLGEVGELEVQMFSFAQMPNRITNVQFSTSAPILPNPCACCATNGLFIKIFVLGNVEVVT
jgi:hypothetical protein